MKVLIFVLAAFGIARAADLCIGAGIGHASESSSERIGDAAEFGLNSSVISQKGIGGGIDAVYAHGKEYNYPSMNYSNTRSQMYVTPYFIAMKSFFTPAVLCICIKSAPQLVLEWMTRKLGADNFPLTDFLYLEDV